MFTGCMDRGGRTAPEGEQIMARKKIIAGNWKMNKTPSEAVELAKTLIPLVADADVDVAAIHGLRLTQGAHGVLHVR